MHSYESFLWHRQRLRRQFRWNTRALLWVQPYCRKLLGTAFHQQLRGRIYIPTTVVWILCQFKGLPSWDALSVYRAGFLTSVGWSSIFAVIKQYVFPQRLTIQSKLIIPDTKSLLGWEAPLAASGQSTRIPQRILSSGNLNVKFSARKYTWNRWWLMSNSHLRIVFGRFPQILGGLFISQVSLVFD